MTTHHSDPLAAAADEQSALDVPANIEDEEEEYEEEDEEFDADEQDDDAAEKANPNATNLAVE